MIQIMNRKRDESGFTLIELLITIVILGILSAIVVFAVSALQDRGVKSACRADVKTVEVASEAYYARHGSYAPTIGVMVTAGFLRQDPNNPPNPNYTIQYPAPGGAAGSVSGTCPS